MPLNTNADLYGLITALQRSIHASKDLFNNPARSPAHKRVLLALESLRIDIRLDSSPDETVSKNVLRAVRDGLIALLNDKGFLQTTERARFRHATGRPERRPEFEALIERNTDLYEATRIIANHFNELVESTSTLDTSETDTAVLRRVLPSQKLAPAMFDIVAGKLVVVKQAANARSDDLVNIQNARETLVSRGKNLVDAFERSNCDRRIVESLRELQEAISRQENIIELGLINLGISQICKSAKSELPEALIGALDGHTTAIGMYVAQFPEWQKFCENASFVEIDAADIALIHDAAQNIIDKFDQHPDIADAEVPKTIKALKLLIANPSTASKRAAFAVLRTIENLVAKIFQYSADFLDQTATKTIKGLSTATSKVIICTLMTLALAATTNLGSVAGKVAETQWMKTAAQIVKKQIEDLEK